MTWTDAAPAIVTMVLGLVCVWRIDRSFAAAKREHERLHQQWRERARLVEAEVADGVSVRAPATRPDDYPGDEP